MFYLWSFILVSSCSTVLLSTWFIFYILPTHCHVSFWFIYCWLGPCTNYKIYILCFTSHMLNGPYWSLYFDNFYVLCFTFVLCLSIIMIIVLRQVLCFMFYLRPMPFFNHDHISFTMFYILYFTFNNQKKRFYVFLPMAGCIVLSTVPIIFI